MSETEQKLQDTPPYEYGEVRRCACHGMYWRPYSYSPATGVVFARGHKERDTFSNEDYVQSFTFEPDDWMALERV